MRTLRLARTASTLGLLAIAAVLTLAIETSSVGPRGEPRGRTTASSAAPDTARPTTRSAGHDVAVVERLGILADVVAEDADRVDAFAVTGLALGQDESGRGAAPVPTPVRIRRADRGAGARGRAPPGDLLSTVRAVARAVPVRPLPLLAIATFALALAFAFAAAVPIGRTDRRRPRPTGLADVNGDGSPDQPIGAPYASPARLSFAARPGAVAKPPSATLPAGRSLVTLDAITAAGRTVGLYRATFRVVP